MSILQESSSNNVCQDLFAVAVLVDVGRTLEFDCVLWKRPTFLRLGYRLRRNRSRLRYMVGVTNMGTADGIDHIVSGSAWVRES